ncbi:MAG: hypothetical protein UT33_C0007G0104 [Candidatus Peregrinibacteria bacterium GW2011_GWC2_39_14]|nr:MAG: hypothetical protein US92_C0002G0106 [Candidatus Peregrinibacteria bacterium GW2011_GWA2_38_36]KKR06916.1 MAG: hypothetical protein UT33_C0007G0104 [Candidatus Peregrinibacteria bacterium GW2011_GWC2_39_14]
MKLSIVKFSEGKAKKTVVNSSKIEGYKVVCDRGVKIKARRIALRFCS